jgi:tRNA/rRNA methyltransferase
VHIPADEQFGSLNLAQAVQVAAYELRMAAGLAAPRAGGPAGAPRGGAAPATLADVEGLYAHLDEAGIESGFFDPRDPKRLRDRWRRLFSRVVLEREEVNILRGLLRALQRGRSRE